MLIHRKEMKVEQKTKMRDGDGTITLTHFIDETNETNLRLIAEITVPPGASIGDHSHDDETEYFIFVSGTGVVFDEGVEKPVAPGDTLVTGHGAAHSVKNTGAVPLIFHAIIVTY
jgi:mannose-6-phosphate isomerase-like protein (cupin superfamily)